MLEPADVMESIRKGLNWINKNLNDLLPDAALIVYAGLLLVDKRIARRFRIAYYNTGIIKMKLPLDYMTASLELFDIFRRAPPFLMGEEIILTQSVGKVVLRKEELCSTDPLLSNRAIALSALRCLDQQSLMWMRKRDTVGYELTHQLLAWIICIKNSYFEREAKKQVVALSARLYIQMSTNTPSICYDLYAESVALLCMAGLSRILRAAHYTEVITSQNSNGSWNFFSARPSHQANILNRIARGESPLIRSISLLYKSMTKRGRTRYLTNIHLGHSTALSIYSLLWMLKGISKEESPVSSHKVNVYAPSSIALNAISSST